MFLFFNNTATTEIYTLSLHDALPIYDDRRGEPAVAVQQRARPGQPGVRGSMRAPGHRAGLGGPGIVRAAQTSVPRSEEHTSELQSRKYTACRLLLEKKN